MAEKTINLFIEGNKVATFRSNGDPHSEKDLVQMVPEYIDFCYRTGIGAPIKAQVTEKSGLFGKKYNFEYTLKGNSITSDELMAIVNQYSIDHQTADITVDAGNHSYRLILVFESESKSLELYRRLNRICNVGAYQGKDRNTGRYIVQIQWKMV